MEYLDNEHLMQSINANCTFCTIASQELVLCAGVPVPDKIMLVSPGAFDHLVYYIWLTTPTPTSLQLEFGKDLAIARQEMLQTSCFFCALHRHSSSPLASFYL